MKLHCQHRDGPCRKVEGSQTRPDASARLECRPSSPRTGLSSQTVRTGSRNRYNFSQVLLSALSLNPDGWKAVVFIAAIVLFLLPCSLLWAAWARFARSAVEAPPQSWRAYCGKSSLILDICSTLLELVFFYSWFHNGGSPHGLMPTPGIWRFVGRISFWTLVGGVVLSVFGKSIPAWAAAYLFVDCVIFMLEMD